jgi:hypothetical protein
VGKSEAFFVYFGATTLRQKSITQMTHVQNMEGQYPQTISSVNWRHDFQHNDTQHSEIHHNNKYIATLSMFDAECPLC